MRALIVAGLLALSAPVLADEAPVEPFPAEIPATPAPAPAPAPAPVVEAAPAGPPVLRIPKPTQGPFAEKRPKISKKPALIATAVTGGLFALTIVSWVHWDTLASNLGSTMSVNDEVHIEDRVKPVERWEKISVGISVLTLISAGVTGYMWSRHDTVPRIDVTPINSGYRVAYSRSF